MQMDEGLDTGPMLLTGELPISPDATAATLGSALAVLGARLGVEGLAGGPTRGAPPPPEGGGACGAPREKAAGAVDW
ncbi:MAG: methionyl-tRNA formyltransferase, partial [bacterium]